jgi:Family of unknown function (DUF6988)
MTQGTMKHLNRVEAAIQQTKPLLGPRKYPADLRTILVGALVTQVIEHHEAMLLLTRNAKYGSAFALGRSIFESMFRGLWFLLCATDADLQYFEQNDELPPDSSGKPMNMQKMASAIDAATTRDPNDPNDFFTDLKKRGWKSLCSYTHSGLLQLGRRFTGDKAEPSYNDEEIVEITTSCSTCILLLVGTFLNGQNYVAESNAAAALIGSWKIK